VPPCRYNNPKSPPPARRAARDEPEEDSIRTLSRFALRFAATAAAAMLVAFALAVVVLRYGIFPRIDDYRGDIEASVSRASGMAVTIADVDAGWQGLRPQLTLTGVRIADRRGKAAFALERADIAVSWWSLLAGDLRFSDVDLYSPNLDLRRGADGRIYLADKPLGGEPGEDDGALAAWLLAQPRLGIHNAALSWRDEQSGAPPVSLRGVEIALRKQGARHRIGLNATPPPELAARLDVRADLALSQPAGRWQVAGTVYVQTDRADIARLRSHLPLPETLRSATGSLRLWLEIEPGRVREVVADLDLRGAKAQLAADALPLELATLAGRVVYREEPGGFHAGTRGLRFRTASGLESAAAAFSLTLGRDRKGAARGEVRADGIDLKIATALLDYRPVPREAKAQVLRFAPRGRLTGSSLVWTGESPAQATSLALKARFENLAINAVEGYPGVTGLTGELEGDEKAGRLRLASRGFTFEAQRFFAAPLAFDAADAEATRRRAAGGLEVRILDATLSNADVAISAAGTWQSVAEQEGRRSPGRVNLTGRIERARLGALPSYLPNAIAETRSWLEKAIEAGEAKGGRFELAGDLWDFPFRGGQGGRFLAESPITGARLRYHPAWPAVERIEGDIRLANESIEVRAAQAAVYSSRLVKTRAFIADMGANPPLLELDGIAETTGGDSVRFLRETPLVEGPGAFTKAVAVEGAARAKIRIAYPLWGRDPVRVKGEYAFDGATASVGRSLALTGVKGTLAFTERSVSAPALAGTMFGQPAMLRLSTQSDGAVLTQLEGRLDAKALAAFVPQAFSRRMAGSTEWKARVVSGVQGTELRVDSSLAGLVIGLPEPFAKTAAQARSLAVVIRQLGTDAEETRATLEGGIHARINRAGPGDPARWQAALRFGSPPQDEPARDGLWLYGAVDRFDLDAWLAALEPPAGAAAATDAPPALELRGLDLAIGTLHYTGRDFRQMQANLVREEGEWRGSLLAPALAGQVAYDPRGRGRIKARLARFQLAASREGESGPEPPAPADETLPDLDIVAERFDFRGKWLGRLEFVARQEGADWRIDRLDIANGHARLASRGVWRRTGPGPVTRLDVKLESSNLNRLLGQFGHGDQVSRGEAKLEGQLVWPGYPYEFALSRLSGQFRLEAAKGQFARIEPGAGKLLGLLSLQSIPRRVLFDFRDVFSDGFAFDRISGDVKLAQGTLSTQDFEIAGPSAFASLAGEVSLPRETQNLTLRVVPEVGEGVAIAATVLGTPVMGLTTLLVQKLLQNPLGKAVSYEYLVTGAWDNPSVTRLSAASPREPAGPAAKPQP
jgi:uncharacterized protein (TIGR02099 family)